MDLSRFNSAPLLRKVKAPVPVDLVRRRLSAEPRIRCTTSSAAAVKARTSPTVIGLTPLEMLSTDKKKVSRRGSTGSVQLIMASFMLDPHSHARLRWDLISVLLIFYGAISIPVSTLKQISSSSRIPVYMNFQVGILVLLYLLL